MKENILILIIILFIIFIIFIILKLLYDRWYPHIDIIKRFNKHTIILWYNKKISKDEVMRSYIKLFEYERTT